MDMITLFKEGGWSMWFILALGFAAVATAFWYALRPAEKHLGFLEWMSRAILWIGVGGVLLDFSTVAHNVAAMEIDSEQRWRIVLQGFGESMAPGVMAFSFLGIVAVLTAIGRRKHDASRAA
jgi:hypothetical protein